mgnify:CR=1 FL=1
MTQEEKAKRYDEAIETASKINSGEGIAAPHDFTICEVIFPELKESEDKKIRNWLIGYFRQYKEDGMEKYSNGLKVDSIIAWIENQVSLQMVADAYLRGCNDTEKKLLDKQCEQKQDKHNIKLPNNFEAKFKVGDWITNGHFTCKVTFVDSRYWYSETCVLGNVTDIDKTFHSWTIEDTKDGDMLVTGNTPFLYSKHDKDKYGIVCFSYGGISSNRDEFIINTNPGNRWCDVKFVKPATKEQCDLLLQKMHEAGYKWDFDKKELKPLMYLCTLLGLNY